MDKPNLRDLAKTIRATEPEALRWTQAHDFARDAYAGWNGWNHQWHWKEHDDLARLRDEAAREAVKLRDAIDHLRDRLDATNELVSLLGKAVQAQGGAE